MAKNDAKKGSGKKVVSSSVEPVETAEGDILAVVKGGTLLHDGTSYEKGACLALPEAVFADLEKRGVVERATGAAAETKEERPAEEKPAEAPAAAEEKPADQAATETAAQDE